MTFYNLFLVVQTFLFKFNVFHDKGLYQNIDGLVWLHKYRQQIMISLGLLFLLFTISLKNVNLILCKYLKLEKKNQIYKFNIVSKNIGSF